jgi:hypothetical protein
MIDTDAMLVICLASPDCEYINESFDHETLTATCVVKLHDSPEHTTTFTPEKAIEEGCDALLSPLSIHPSRLQIKARAIALKDNFSDLLRKYL